MQQGTNTQRSEVTLYRDGNPAQPSSMGHGGNINTPVRRYEGMEGEREKEREGGEVERGWGVCMGGSHR